MQKVLFRNQKEPAMTILHAGTAHEPLIRRRDSNARMSMVPMNHQMTPSDDTSEENDVLLVDTVARRQCVQAVHLIVLNDS